MDPWFHFTLSRVKDLHHLAGDHLETPQGPLVVPGPPVENHCSMTYLITYHIQYLGHSYEIFNDKSMIFLRHITYLMAKTDIIWPKFQPDPAHVHFHYKT